MASRTRALTRPAAASPASRPRWWTWLATVEVALATVAVLRDLLIPSLVLVLLAGTSLAVRRQSPTTLAVRRAHARGLVSKMLVVAAAWSLVQLSLTRPLAAHLSGRKQTSASSTPWRVTCSCSWPSSHLAPVSL